MGIKSHLPLTGSKFVPSRTISPPPRLSGMVDICVQLSVRGSYASFRWKQVSGPSPSLPVLPPRTYTTSGPLSSLVAFQSSAHCEHTAAAAPSSCFSGASTSRTRSLECRTPSTTRCVSARIASAKAVSSVDASHPAVAIRRSCACERLPRPASRETSVAVGSTLSSFDGMLARKTSMLPMTTQPPRSR
eukprot:scaffold127184_cov84-Phaeocystis_antarctica.AAC.4